MTSLRVHVTDNLHYLTTVNGEFVNGRLGSLGIRFVAPRTIPLAAHGTRAAPWSEDDAMKLYTQQVDQAVLAVLEAVRWA